MFKADTVTDGDDANDADEYSDDDVDDTKKEKDKNKDKDKDNDKDHCQYVLWTTEDRRKGLKYLMDQTR